MSGMKIKQLYTRVVTKIGYYRFPVFLILAEDTGADDTSVLAERLRYSPTLACVVLNHTIGPFSIPPPFYVF